MLLRTTAGACVRAYSRCSPRRVTPRAVATMAAASSASDASPLFRVGLVTDVQHADIPDGACELKRNDHVCRSSTLPCLLTPHCRAGASFMGTPRFYRNAVACLHEAVSAWRSLERLSCVLHLGDILDGLQAAAGTEASEASLARVLGAFEPLAPVPVYHALGNHCLTCLKRPTLHTALQIPDCPATDGAACYTFAPHAGFRVVVLDSYDVSMFGACDARREQARALLASKNPNENPNSPTGLEGLERRFVAFGGGVSERQLDWLRAVLTEAEAARERVFLAVHTPLHPASAPPVCLSWSYEELLACCARHRCVVATLAGHAHGGGYARDEAGVHHFVLPAVLECPPGENAFGHVDVYDSGFALRGTGRMASTDMLPYRDWGGGDEAHAAPAAAPACRVE